MTKALNRGVAAAVFACLSSVSPALAQVREPIHVHVSRAGLDVTTPEGRQLLTERIRIAANATCISSAIGMEREFDERRCRAEMMKDGAQQVAALAGRRDVEVASTGR